MMRKSFYSCALLILSLFLLVSCSGAPPRPALSYKQVPQTKTEPEKEPTLTASEYEAKGDRLAESGAPEAAFINYLRAEELAPLNFGPHFKLGLLYISKKMYKEAEAQITSALKITPDDPSAIEAMGKVELATGRLEEAKASYEKALSKQKDPLSWKAYNALGFIADRQGRYGEAKKYYMKALAGSPDNPVILNNLGVSSLLAGDEASAEKYLSTAREKAEPSKPGIISNNLGLVFARKGDYQSALEYFREAGDSASAYYNLGCIYMSEGKYTEAESAFENAIKSSPGYYEKARDNLSRAKEAAGD